MSIHRMLLAIMAATILTGLSGLASSADRDDPRDRKPPAQDRNRDGDEGTEEGMPEARTVPGERVRPRRLNWRLGVFAVNTETGVRVTRVLPGSAAFKAGLERGDVIVTVNGYQVGQVKGRVYPLGEEVQRRAGARGEVTLLTQNVRNKELVNLEVALDRPQIEPLPREREGDRPGDRERSQQ